MQHNPVSASLHLVYAMVMVIFSVLRIMTFFYKSLGVFAAFSGTWASLLIFCASEDGVKFEINNDLDVPATALLTGIAAASLIIILTCLAAGRTKEFARMADDDYTDYAHSRDDFERLKDLTLSSIKSFEGIRRRKKMGKGYNAVGVEEEGISDIDDDEDDDGDGEFEMTSRKAVSTPQHKSSTPKRRNPSPKAPPHIPVQPTAAPPVAYPDLDIFASNNDLLEPVKSDDLEAGTNTAEDFADFDALAGRASPSAT